MSSNAHKIFESLSRAHASTIQREADILSDIHEGLHLHYSQNDVSFSKDRLNSHGSTMEVIVDGFVYQISVKAVKP